MRHDPLAKLLSLPPPDSHYHFFALADGSRIYPSGVVFHAKTKQARWFVWRCTGSHELEEWDAKGNRRSLRLVRDGEVWADPGGIKYFDTPDEALAALNGDKR